MAFPKPNFNLGVANPQVLKAIQEGVKFIELATKEEQDLNFENALQLYKVGLAKLSNGILNQIFVFQFLRMQNQQIFWN